MMLVSSTALEIVMANIFSFPPLRALIFLVFAAFRPFVELAKWAWDIAFDPRSTFERAPRDWLPEIAVAMPARRRAESFVERRQARDPLSHRAGVGLCLAV